jgi:hypothetical protein
MHFLKRRSAKKCTACGASAKVLLERCQHHAVKVKSNTRFSSLPRMTTDPLLRLITSPLLRLMTSQLMSPRRAKPETPILNFLRF